MVIKNYCLVFMLLLWSSLVAAQTTADNNLPIIDVHLHATSEKSGTMVTELEPVLQQMSNHNVVLSVLSGADRELADKWKATTPDRFIIGPSFPCTDGIYPRMYPCFKENKGWPEIEWLENQFKTGRASVMGELLYVYYGIKPSDERLAPYFDLAEKYSIPVGVHSGHGPPPNKRLPGCCPDFNEKMGDPFLLKPVLKKHPDLHIWLMHAGEVKFHNQAIELMKSYPNVYADLSIINGLYPEDLYGKLLRDFIEAGLENRIMFGSDNLPIGPIIKRLKSFEFLSDKQQRKILYSNAANFFELSKETIAKHHGK